MDLPQGAGRPRLTFHGRRHGRRLRPGRHQRLQETLPRLRVPSPRAGGTIDPRSLFERPVREVWLEVGFGAGEHLAALAAAHPDVGLLGCEPYVNGVAALLARIEDERLGNVRIFDDDARLLLPGLADASIARTLVMFPDPWPKARHAGRRFVGRASLDELGRIMVDAGDLLVATDHPVMVRWALQHGSGHPAFAWCARRPADWRERPEGAAPTRYEEKARERGAACVYLRFRRTPRTLA